MQASLLFTITLAALVSSSPITSRQNLQCSRSKPAKLFLKEINKDDVLIPVALTNYQLTDSKGNYSSVLVTEALDGSAVSPATFDFASCSSSYIKAANSESVGHISAYGETGPPHRCLSSTNFKGRSIFTNSVCPNKDDESQIDSLFEWNDFKTGGTNSSSEVEFLGLRKNFQDQVLTISKTKGEHGSVLLWESEKEISRGEKTYRFVLQQ